MAEQQLGLPVEGLERPLRDLSYVDDATFLHACRAASALGDLAMLTCIAHHRFCQAHLRVNYDAGKTESLCSVRGPGAKQ
eukprot:5818285-Alexandrium_andersonii.AAC.1